jgi:hypothetical protein
VWLQRIQQGVDGTDTSKVFNVALPSAFQKQLLFELFLASLFKQRVDS